jgi:hypothetical protein
MPSKCLLEASVSSDRRAQKRRHAERGTSFDIGQYQVRIPSPVQAAIELSAVQDVKELLFNSPDRIRPMLM